MAHTIPTAAQFKARHPRFAAVGDATVDAYIADAAIDVTTAWDEADYAVGIMLLAAHLMVMEGALDPAGTALGVGNQIKKVKAGEVETEFSTDARTDGVGGKLWATYSRTIYGQRYVMLAQRNGASDAAVVVV